MRFDADLFSAVFLHMEHPELTVATQDMPDWEYNALQFMNANPNLEQFQQTEEYQCAVALVGFKMDDLHINFHF